MSALSDLVLEMDLGIPLAALAPEARVERIAAWLGREEHQRLDNLLAKYKAASRGLPRAEARRIWREAFAVYAALTGV
jgi:hypothetical protein